MENIQEQNYIEIVLPDMKGHDVRLSDQEGNVVLLNFTAYEAEYSGPYNMQLAKIFDKYKNKGFTIYQVSLDSDDNFRKITSSNLPWITVHDKESVYSRFARSYNVTSLPTSYLLDKDGSIVLRVNNLDDLDKEIAKLL